MSTSSTMTNTTHRHPALVITRACNLAPHGLMDNPTMPDNIRQYFREFRSILALYPGVKSDNCRQNPALLAKFHGNLTRPNRTAHIFENLMLSCKHSVVSHLIPALF